MPEQMRPMSMTPLDYDREKSSSSSSKVKVEKENLILSFMCRTLKAHTVERLELPPIPTAALLLKKKSLISGCFEYRQRFSIFTRQAIRIQKVGSHPQ